MPVLMLEKLVRDSNKVPAPTRNEMVRMFVDALYVANFNCTIAFRSVWMANPLDDRKINWSVIRFLLL